MIDPGSAALAVEALTRIIHEIPETPSPAPSPIEGEGHIF